METSRVNADSRKRPSYKSIAFHNGTNFAGKMVFCASFVVWVCVINQRGSTYEQTAPASVRVLIHYPYIFGVCRRAADARGLSFFSDAQQGRAPSHGEDPYSAGGYYCDHQVVVVQLRYFPAGPARVKTAGTTRGGPPGNGRSSIRAAC